MPITTPDEVDAVADVLRAMDDMRRERSAENAQRCVAAFAKLLPVIIDDAGFRQLSRKPVA